MRPRKPGLATPAREKLRNKAIEAKLANTFDELLSGGQHVSTGFLGQRVVLPWIGIGRQFGIT